MEVGLGAYSHCVMGAQAKRCCPPNFKHVSLLATEADHDCHAAWLAVYQTSRRQAHPEAQSVSRSSSYAIRSIVCYHSVRNLDISEARRLARENAKDIIACGFDVERTFIFSDFDYVGGEFYRNIVSTQR